MATLTKEPLNRSAQLALRITPELKEMILKQATKKGMNVHAYLAHLANLDRLIENKLMEIENSNG